MNGIVNLALSDGQIIDIKGYVNEVTVTVKDWREKNIELRFSDVWGIETCCPFSTDLDRLVVDEHLNHLEQKNGFEKQDLEQTKRFLFYDADECPVLIVYGEDLLIENETFSLAS